MILKPMNYAYTTYQILNHKKSLGRKQRWMAYLSSGDYEDFAWQRSPRQLPFLFGALKAPFSLLLRKWRPRYYKSGDKISTKGLHQRSVNIGYLEIVWKVMVLRNGISMLAERDGHQKVSWYVFQGSFKNSRLAWKEGDNLTDVPTPCMVNGYIVGSIINFFQSFPTQFPLLFTVNFGKIWNLCSFHARFMGTGYFDFQNNKIILI